MGNIDEGVGLFNEGRFFDAHDAWKEQWLEAHEVLDKELFQGLIAVAAALHHYTKHDLPGFQKLLAKGIDILQGSSEAHRIFDCERFLRALHEVQSDIIVRKKRLSAQDFPHIRHHERGRLTGGD